MARDVDINPNVPTCIMSGGDDGKIKFWDTRKYDEPLKVLSKNSHWVWKVQFNKSFDSLVLSSSTDGTVNLWNIQSLSFKNSTLKGESKKQEDKLIKTFNDHEDSVYSICWGACDNMTFASLSYDGRLVVNRVPDSEAQQILGGI
eukprot:TRINITY_DN2625_c0_g1_i2.p2 TRINITY_DN2625_c0_g1~~TRINITY_DN2625_c0_g1_i2.p2  ORF type:complete len:145 (-),score=36.58 TRINITY_DN2625_c0_g1_i2:69-503(-)